MKIIDAILLAAEVFRAGKLPEGPGDWSVGSRVPRIDAEEKVRGTGIYPDDIYLDGMIYASAIRSAYPRARVLAIHPEEALALPGVVSRHPTSSPAFNNCPSSMLNCMILPLASEDTIISVASNVPHAS